MLGFGHWVYRAQLTLEGLPQLPMPRPLQRGSVLCACWPQSLGPCHHISCLCMQMPGACISWGALGIPLATRLPGCCWLRANEPACQAQPWVLGSRAIFASPVTSGLEPPIQPCYPPKDTPCVELVCRLPPSPPQESLSRHGECGEAALQAHHSIRGSQNSDLGSWASVWGAPRKTLSTLHFGASGPPVLALGYWWGGEPKGEDWFSQGKKGVQRHRRRSVN